MNYPQKCFAELISKKYITPKVLLLDLKMTNPTRLKFEPGQYISILIAETTYRAYSILSDYKNNKIITIVASVAHTGLGADYLKNLPINRKIEFVGPSGRFLFDHHHHKDIVFCATGTGIVPFISYMHKIEELNFLQKIRFLYGVRTQDDIFLLDRLNYYKNFLSDFDYELFVSQPTDDDHSCYKVGRITGAINKYIDINTQYYLCGNPNMIDEIRKILLSAKIKDEDIKSEKFLSPIE